MTKVLVGIDPNDYWVVALQPVYDVVKCQTGFIDSPNDELHIHQYYIGPSWLPYQNTSQDSDHSEIGDWDPDYFDNSANQAFHFWFYVAATYYNGEDLAFFANAIHDPWYLTAKDIAGKDLNNWEESSNDYLRIWANNASDTSIEDYNLGIKGIQLGRIIQNPHSSIQPGTWILDNLRAKEK